MRSWRMLRSGLESAAAERDEASETRDVGKRWSLAEIIRRNGLNQKLIGGKDKYDEFLANLNKDLPEEEKVVLLDSAPWKHWL